MKFKFFTFLLISFLLSTKASIAANVYAWSVSSGNLVGGELFLNQTGTTSVTFTIDVVKADGETGTNIPFALVTKKIDGTVQLLSSVNNSTDTDYPSGSLYGTKAVTVTISNSNVINSTVYLVTSPLNNGQYTFFTGPYTVTNSSTVSSGAVTWHGATSLVNYIDHNTLTGTIIHTSYNPVLTSGQSLYSAGGFTRLTLQTDGNLVIYQVSTGKAVWASQTNDNKAKSLYFQPGDGNLVLKDANNQPTGWSSFIYADGGNMNNAQYAIFVVQDDGNFVMMEDSKYSYAPRTGYYLVLGDTNSGGFIPSKHFGKID